MVNVVGTFSVTKSFLPLLKKGISKTIINISSNAASLSRNYSQIHQPGVSDASLALSYRVAKVGVNMGRPHPVSLLPNPFTFVLLISCALDALDT